MQLNVDVHNYMETLVGQILADETFTARFDNDQLADIACLALVQMKPVYIRHDVDFLSALPENRLVAFIRGCEAAIENAVEMIIDDRRTHREADIPVVLKHMNYSDDQPLEWYESPIVNFKSD